MVKLKTCSLVLCSVCVRLLSTLSGSTQVQVFDISVCSSSLFLLAAHRTAVKVHTTTYCV